MSILQQKSEKIKKHEEQKWVKETDGIRNAVNIHSR